MAMLFPSGRILATDKALEALERSGLAEATALLRRHLEGDWGDLDEDDRASNRRAVRLGHRVLSAYRLSDGTRVWIITEADRSATTILLPEEY